MSFACFLLEVGLNELCHSHLKSVNLAKVSLICLGQELGKKHGTQTLIFRNICNAVNVSIFLFKRNQSGWVPRFTIHRFCFPLGGDPGEGGDMLISGVCV